jgi:hypothetical protein
MIVACLCIQTQNHIADKSRLKSEKTTRINALKLSSDIPNPKEPDNPSIPLTILTPGTLQGSNSGMGDCRDCTLYFISNKYRRFVPASVYS